MNGFTFYLQGWVELLARYRTVWRHAWQRRHEMTPPVRSADELAFLPAALALQETPVSPVPRVTAWLLMSSVMLEMGRICFKMHTTIRRAMWLRDYFLFSGVEISPIFT